ncbi:hypothetical protein NLG97_g8209 [Lecanicillium saksenae]|uniref:Uncharacterized protein n=1 Tax=Lecanicillium saksenae TaxID=468837 RepID=A0ACC1QJM8_9HYPO|nr:hypothetical protein NLG97_g8209 [Lecanicillium saksenae]
MPNMRALFSTRGWGLRHGYEALQKPHASFDLLIRARQAQDQSQAGYDFQMLRGGLDADDIVIRISTGGALMDLRLETETKLRFEFPYGSQMPFDIQSSNMPYLQSPIYEIHMAPEETARWDGYPRLKLIFLSKWISVSKDDGMMRKLFEDFFLYEYPWYPFVRIDHLLDEWLLASVCYMQLYFLRHGCDMSDTYITHGLATLALITLNRLKQTSAAGAVSADRVGEIRSTLFLMAKGLYNQENFY